MITGGALKKERLILTTRSPQDAVMVKHGLSGKNSFFSTAPYGNKVDLVIEDYHKKYMCLEIKKKKNKATSVFPIAHSLDVIHANNYAAVIAGIDQT